LQLTEAIGGDGVRLHTVDTPDEALRALDGEAFDCIVLEAAAQPAAALEPLAEILRQSASRSIPVVFSPPDAALSESERERFERLYRAGGVRPVRSIDRLVDQALLHMHRPISQLPPKQRERIERLYATDEVLAGKKVLIVDDDIRNIFAITSVLERQRMDVISAETATRRSRSWRRSPAWTSC
jgi:CheY-like chemotaxis protein